MTDNMIRGEEVDLSFIEHFGYNEFHESRPLPWHKHDGFEFVYMLEGSGTYENECGTIHRLNGGEFSFLPRDVSHHGKDDQNAPCLMSWIVFAVADPDPSPIRLFSEEEYRQLMDRCSAYGASSRYFSPELHRLLNELKKNISLWKSGSDDILLAARLRGIVLELILSSLECLESPRARTANEYVCAAMAFLEEHQANDISMVDVAEHLGFSSSRFYHMFKEQTGRTPNDHLMRLRLESATELLRKTDLSLDKICSRTGFSSAQYFCRVFRKYTGRRPSDARK